MYLTTTTEYQDADDRRGKTVTTVHLEDSDKYEIMKQIREYIEATDELPETSFEVFLMSGEGEEACVDIITTDYMTLEEQKSYLGEIGND